MDPSIPLQHHAKRRDALAATLEDGEILLLPTHPEQVFSRDVHFPFRPHSDFWYLTGFAEPESLLALDSDGHATLYLRDSKPEAEVWNGKRLGLAAAREHFDADVKDIETLASSIEDLVGDRLPVLHANHHPALKESLLNKLAMVESRVDVTHDLRLRKDAQEIAMLQKANDLGIEAMREGFRAGKDGGNERDMAAAISAYVESSGSEGWGYPSIVGSGANAAVLHYIENNGSLRAGDLTLIDAGCTWGYYTSDLTRTAPVGGKASEAHERLHDVVARAQEAAIAQVRVGNTIRSPHETAVHLLTEGLVEEGLLHGDVDELVHEQAFRPWYMHGTSHWLGLDVHDVGAVLGDDGKPRKLEAGMVLTVEPGLYGNHAFNPDSRSAPEFGIRLENDVVVTSDGPLDLSAKMPSDLQRFLDWIA